MKARLIYILLIFSALCGSAKLNAQSTELGLQFGTTSYRGELNPHLVTSDLSVYHPAFGIFLRRNWNSHYSFRFSGMYGKLSGNDAHQSSAFAKSRNLNFTSPLVEAGGFFEFNFFPYEKYGSPYKVTPFVFTGLSIFYFSPSGNTADGKTFTLSDKNIEGASYSPIQLALPMGVGIKARLGSFNFGLELAPRKASTDYLDNVSGLYLDNNALKGASKALSNPSADTAAITIAGRQRGIAADKDWYMFVGMTLSHKIGQIRKRECDRLLRDQ